MSLGIIFALVAMLFWGFGDFLIQRSTRKLGDFETLFLITFFGTIILYPFVHNDLGTAMRAGNPILWGAGIVLFIAALLEFEALKRGKISVIEPTWSLEIPTTAIMAYVILGEFISLSQIGFIVALIVGLFMVSYKGAAFSKRFFFEKGVLISIVAASVMGIANFFVGWGARESTPLLINFFVNIVSMIGSGVYLLAKGKLGNIFSHIVKNPSLILPMVVLDNIAWIAFAFAMTLAPIGIATALSESYIIIAVLLGIFISREKLERHQKLGLVIAVGAAILLALLST